MRPLLSAGDPPAGGERQRGKEWQKCRPAEIAEWTDPERETDFSIIFLLLSLSASCFHRLPIRKAKMMQTPRTLDPRP
jgi:hypothetical protein